VTNHSHRGALERLHFSQQTREMGHPVLFMMAEVGHPPPELSYSSVHSIDRGSSFEAKKSFATDTAVENGTTCSFQISVSCSTVSMLNVVVPLLSRPAIPPVGVKPG